jgi:hypothetical protein
MTSPRSPLLSFPNELLFEVASNLESFEDLNCLALTSRFLHALFNPLLYRRAVEAKRAVREDIVGWVLCQPRLASLTHLLDNGLSVHQKLRPTRDDMLRCLCFHFQADDAVPLARLLIERGADIEAKTKNGQTVIHIAAFNDYGISALLLEHGADANATDVYGSTPLHYAIYHNRNGRIVKLLLAHGAVVDARDSTGLTPLHLASRNQKKAAIKLLLEHGADVNARDAHGSTPLQMARLMIHGPNEAVVQLLLKHGAVAGVTNNQETEPQAGIFQYYVLWSQAIGKGDGWQRRYIDRRMQRLRRMILDNESDRWEMEVEGDDVEESDDGGEEDDEEEGDDGGEEDDVGFRSQPSEI